MACQRACQRVRFATATTLYHDSSYTKEAEEENTFEFDVFYSSKVGYHPVWDC